VGLKLRLTVRAVGSELPKLIARVQIPAAAFMVNIWEK
jgi:hypothetical protein